MVKHVYVVTSLSIYVAQQRDKMNGKEERDWKLQHQCQQQCRAEGCDGSPGYLLPLQRNKPTVEDVAQGASSCVRY